MPAAPPKQPKLTALSRAAAKLVVLLGPDDGSAPTMANEVDFLVPLRIERSAGGSRVNSMALQYLLAKDQEHVIDTLTPKSVNRQVEIREVDAFGDAKRVLAWGKLAAQPIQIGESESVSWAVRIDKHHFGVPLGPAPYWLSAGFLDSVEDFDLPWVFNPEIDDQIKGNRSNMQSEDTAQRYAFFDAAVVDTSAGRVAHGQTVSKWRLFEAVHTLVWTLNPDETFIKNPTRADCSIELAEVDSEHERLKNLTLPVNQYLPELLDQLLEPFGCTWTIDITIDPVTDLSVRRFRFFRRNVGTKRELFLQRPGEDLDPTKSTVPDLSLNFDIAKLANKIIGCTSLIQREATWPLYFGWPVSEDSLDRDVLETDSAAQKAHPHAGHKLVLNETGAWTGLRPEIVGPRSLRNVLGTFTLTARARKFKPCLSRVVSGETDKLESRGIWLEWLDPADNTWKKPKWSFSVLQLECGIWLETIPRELWDAIQDDPSTTGVRVTATLEGDTRTYAEVGPAADSPNADEIILRLNLGDKFHDRAVHSSSIFYTDRATADEASDQIAMQAYLAQVRGLEDAAELSCSAPLEGIDHPEYEIGDLITSVNGRNLKLSRNNPALFTTERFLQIVGINYELKDGQRMELLLESFDEERAL